MDIFCVKISSKLSFIILYLKAAVCFVWREVSQTQILPFHQPQPSPDLSVCDHFCHICRLSQKTEKWLLTRYNQRSVDIKLNKYQEVLGFDRSSRSPNLCLPDKNFSRALFPFLFGSLELFRAWEHARD